MAMINHYQCLGIPSEQGSQLTLRQIEKAYRIKARELHPDKRPNDPNAHSNFQNLQFSYNFLRDENSRKSLDQALLRRRRSNYESNRRKMMSERQSFDPVSNSKATEEEIKRIVDRFEEETKRIVDRFREEINSIRRFMMEDEIRSNNNNKRPTTSESSFRS